MQKLLDTFVSAKEVNELTRLVNIFETEFEEEVQRVEGKSAKADTILSAVSAVVKEKMESNPAFYKSIAQQIEDVINEYKAKRLSEEEKLAKAKQLKDLITGISKPNEDKYPKEFENKKTLIAIYDNLSDILSNLEVVDFDLIVKNLTLKYHEAYLLHEEIGKISHTLEVSNYTSLKVLNFYSELDQYLTQNLQIR